MSQIKTLNGVQYTLPQFNDTGWGANTGNVLTQYIAAIADVTLQLSGGSFTLTAETDFGASFGIKALYLKSETTNPASAGVLRLAKTDAVKWRNNANGADISLAIDGSDNLTYSGTKVIISGAIVNADIAAGAAIAYSKLALTGAILNADLAGSIAYSKLTLTGSVVNADIASAAAIAVNKLAALGATLVAVTDASGFLSTTSVTTTPTELNFVHGVTSAIQTQIGTKAAIAGQQFTGNVSFDSATHGIVGTAGGSSPAAGNIGERIASDAGAVNAAGTNVFTDVTSITLTSGVWDISCIGTIERGAATVDPSNPFSVGISTTSGTTFTNAGSTHQNWQNVPTNSANYPSTGAVTGVRVSTAGATYYLKMRVTYSAGTPTFEGAIWGVRV